MGSVRPTADGDPLARISLAFEKDGADYGYAQPAIERSRRDGPADQAMRWLLRGKAALGPGEGRSS
jgi:hypothetical protein